MDELKTTGEDSGTGKTDRWPAELVTSQRRRSTAKSDTTISGQRTEKSTANIFRDGEMEVLQEQIDRRKSLQAQLKETAIRHAESAPAQVGF